MARVCACNAGTQLDIADAARISREISEAEDNSDAASARTTLGAIQGVLTDLHRACLRRFSQVLRARCGLPK